MDTKIRRFTNLKVWQERHALVILIYNLTKKFPKEETFGLISQMRRAAVSITSNIAEGFGRHSYKEKVQFYYMAQGSMIELENQLLIAKDVNIINVSESIESTNQLSKVHKLLQGLISKSKSFVIHKS